MGLCSYWHNVGRWEDWPPCLPTQTGFSSLMDCPVPAEVVWALSSLHVGLSSMVLLIENENLLCICVFLILAIGVDILIKGEES